MMPSMHKYHLFFLPFVFLLIHVSPAQSQSLFEKPNAQINAFTGTCRTKYRTYDGKCNSRTGWGSTNRAQMQITRSNRKEHLRPSARLISNMLIHQNNSIPNKRGMSEMVTFFGQLLDHTFVSTPTVEGERMDIDVPDDDEWFGRITGKTGRKLKFLKSQKFRGRAVNTLSSFIDGSSIYGNSEERARALRSLKDGMMKVGDGDFLPKNTLGIENAPTKGSRKFFIAGDDRSNEHPVLTCLHTIFVREHNLIANEVKEKNKNLNDEEIFQRARKINIGQFQRIVYKEFLPAMLGEGALPKYRRRNPWINPDVSMVFTTAAFRVGHTLVNDKVSRKGEGNADLPGIELKSAFFAPELVEKNGVDDFIRGAVKTPTQEVDIKVVSNLRNFLFTKVEQNFPEVSGFDLASLNIQRGRDHKIGDYMHSRQRYGLRRDVRKWEDISEDKDLVRKLKELYKNDIGNIDAWVGGLLENHKPGSSLGPFFHAVWVRDFTRMRDADFFYYEKKGEFTPEERDMYPRVKKLFDDKAYIMRDIILRTTSIKESELQKNVFFV